MEDNHEEQLPPSQLDLWLKRISERDMPVFDCTARNVSGVTWRRDSTASQLAREILNDTAFTAKVLKMANSVYFNPGRKSINTITRGVVVLGFNTIRSICLSISALESMNSGTHKNKVMQEMAHCFHAAVQARNLAQKCKRDDAEEIYVSALLRRIGELAFWCNAGPVGKKLMQEMGQSKATSGAIEQRVLGFRLGQLTTGLCKEWRLGDLLLKVTSDDKRNSKNLSVQIIHAGHDVAEAVSAGWEDRNARRKLTEVAKRFNMEVKAFREMAYNSVEQAVDSIEIMGGAALGDLIPLPEKVQQKRVKDHLSLKKRSAYFDPDQPLQQRIMEEIDKLVQFRFDINMLLEMVNEGLYRGVGLDRAFFALLTPDRCKLKAKHLLGWQNSGAGLVIDLPKGHAAGQQDIFSQVMHHAKPAWVRKGSPAMGAAILALSQGAGFFMSPVLAGRDVVGLFYADRQPSGRELDADSFRQFVRFVSRAGEAFTLVSLAKTR